jgi:hypothetical protein
MGMAKYLNKELFLQSMGLVGDETKYGNRDAEHSNRSYSTWMGYEIMGSVDDSEVEEDVVEVVRCKDCVNYCGFEHCKNGICDVDSVSKRAVYPDDFCSYGERREGE